MSFRAGEARRGIPLDQASGQPRVSIRRRSLTIFAVRDDTWRPHLSARAVLTGSALSIGAALLVVVLMVRTRATPPVAAVPVLAEGDSGLETPASPLGSAPPKVS